MTTGLQRISKKQRADTLYVGSVEKAFDVLKAFRAGQRELGLSDLSLKQISDLSGLDKSASQRFTNTLVELGYLEKDQRTRRYRPAVRLLDFAYTYLVSNRLAEIAMPRLIEASKVYGTTVNLCELSGTDIIYTLRIPHQKEYFRATLPGRRIPAFSASGGIVILAQSPPDMLDFVLEHSDYKPITQWTVTDPKAVRVRISEANRNGYDLGVQQSLPHEISTAAPVLNSEGKAFAAVQIPVYMPEWTTEMVEEKIVPLVMETARAISGSDFADS